MPIPQHAYIKNGELILPLEYELSQEEKAIIRTKNIKVKYTDKEGRFFLKEKDNFIALHPLRQTKAHAEELDFSKFPQYLKIKPYTALNANENIFKGDIQIKFRGELDDCLAHILFLDTLTESQKVKEWLYVMRSALNSIMAATCMDMVITPFEIEGLSADQIHEYSHNPLKYLHHDHIVPSFEHGEEAIRINTLRTKIRLTEVSAYSIYAQSSGISHPDILYTLNRLSSACYVLMIMLAQENKQADEK